MNAAQWKELERIVREKGDLDIGYEQGGCGLGLYWSACVGNEWPYCSGGTMERALEDVVRSHLRVEKEALQERINAIDGSAML